MTAVASVPNLIEVATAHCALGTVLVARTSRGICAIQLADSTEAALAAFEAGLAEGSSAVEAGEEMQADLRRVLDLLADPTRPVTFTLDIQGTPFQQQVWKALRQIPVGATISYLDLAWAIGRPAAVRAVAQACGANPIAVAIPCHRVVQSDGGLGGYHWGVERKRALLAQEQVA
jgi:AraC family transcriptional regulator of adaptative response/methylated-DNA-[protein]-cysteine methyltransferase